MEQTRCIRRAQEAVFYPGKIGRHQASDRYLRYLSLTSERESKRTVDVAYTTPGGPLGEIGR
jgi:hypothetical protein